MTKGNRGEAQARGCREGWGTPLPFSFVLSFKKKKKGRGVIGRKGRERTPEQYVSSRGGRWEQSPERCRGQGQGSACSIKFLRSFCRPSS